MLGMFLFSSFLFLAIFVSLGPRQQCIHVWDTELQKYNIFTLKNKAVRLIPCVRAVSPCKVLYKPLQCVISCSPAVRAVYIVVVCIFY